MRRAALLLSLSAALAVLAAPARAGAPITTLPACGNSYLYYSSGVSRADFRTALLCLINGARKAQHLPALRRSAPLEAVGQGQSDTFAATGSASHGTTLTAITRRFAKHGYRAAAYNEGFAVLDAQSSPYAFLADMLAHGGVPCTEILDPRFRDVGIGVSAGRNAPVTTLALELGRKAGTGQPSSNTRAAASCGHKVPKPLISGPAVEGHGDPVVTDTAVTVQLQCTARVACTLTATLALPDAKATAPAQTVTIPAGTLQDLTFAFDATAIATAKAAAQPHLSLALKVTAPAQYQDTLTAPLTSSG